MATFGDIKSVLKKNTEPAVYAAAGVVGIGAVKYGLNTIKLGGVPLASKIPAPLLKFMPLLASLVAAAGAVVLGKKSKKALSFAGGSIAAGVALTTYDLLKGQFPALADLETYRLPSMGYVVPTSEATRLNGLANLGLITPDTGSHRLNSLAQSAMHGVDELVEWSVP